MKTVRFDPFVLDGERRLLLREGQPVHLSPKAYELLALLAERCPAAVSKTEIRDRLWPRTFVADAGLAALVNEVRRALGECARHAAVIRTVHGFGYAFDAVEAAGVGSRVSADAGRQCRMWISYEGREYVLCDGENTVGRDADVRVRIDAPTVSRHHARIVVSGCAATIQDLGSKNRTCVRGQPVLCAVPLTDGDAVAFGEAVTVFHNLNAPNATATVRG